ncbi:class I SAM-dependent methyltransferase [Mucilaginibacter aquariorum]|uniref:Class I SAM-dependent methyltransferase n=1 Tax=Mucilaginibacter aquariorum TaxID=2967225 RepID=A0ABT1SY73_9SPHI|nr:class I SAM-dependent methyltransferase [Mucilaginibacter aquariorum]MCQ6957163.1 class I SAM-dependent methyltransferase [Mucilaginibacter aquariorum]
MKDDPFSHLPLRPRDWIKQEILRSPENNLVNKRIFSNDTEFDWLYPKHFQLLPLKYFTPLSIAQKAAEFLSLPNARVLDIGSGAGKFCLAAGYHFRETFFYGVEQRHELHHLAEDIKKSTNLPNVNFIYGNITQINFKEFDHFYFYNSFYENIDPVNQIDNTIELSEGLYNYYTQYLYMALSSKPAGTRLVTFHSLEHEIPPEYRLADVSSDTLLKMWIKE